MNDSMTMPVSFTGYLRQLWRKWKDGRVDEQEARRVAMLLFAWLDTVNQSEPSHHLSNYK